MTAAPLDGYVRVSRVGGRKGEGFISPDVQEQAILDWAKRNDRQVGMQPHELSVSGGTMDRPIFNELMERVRAGESGGIVVYKTDRFARSLLGAVTTLAELGQHNAAFASVTEPQLDYSTPAGQAFLHMLFVFAEFVRATIKESWDISARKAVERGSISPPLPTSGTSKATTAGWFRAQRRHWRSRSLSGEATTASRGPRLRVAETIRAFSLPAERDRLAAVLELQFERWAESSAV